MGDQDGLVSRPTCFKARKIGPPFGQPVQMMEQEALEKVRQLLHLLKDLAD
jgi:hypothetical protein